MRFLIILCIVAFGCGVEDLSSGHEFECEGFLVCDDKAYKTVASGCAGDKEEAEMLAEESILTLSEAADCTEIKVYMSCVDQGDSCVYKE